MSTHATADRLLCARSRSHESEGFENENIMIDADDAKINQETWNKMVRCYEFWLTLAHFQYLAPLRDLVKNVAASDKATKFRAGQSMYTLIISTTSYYGLKDNDSCVSVDVLRPEGNEAVLFELRYGRGRALQGEKRVCTQENIFVVLNELLDKLWQDTKNI